MSHWMEEFLNKSLGAILDSPANATLPNTEAWPSTLLFVVLAYALVVMVSLLGNSLILHVIVRSHSLHNVPRFLLANLAMADLLVTCANVPLTLTRLVLDEWPFGEVSCRFFNFLLMTCVYACAFSMVSIAGERYSVIVHPLHRRLSRKRSLCVVAVLWLVAFALSSPFAVFSRVQSVDLLRRNVQRCRLCYPHPAQRSEQIVTLSTLFLQYALPLVVTSFLYARLICQIWWRPLLGQSTRSHAYSKAKKKSVLMLMAVVFVYFLCWLPLHLYHVITDFHPNVRYNSKTYLFCHWMAASSVAYNPFLYCWFNEMFRFELSRRLFCCGKPRPRPQPELFRVFIFHARSGSRSVSRDVAGRGVTCRDTATLEGDHETRDKNSRQNSVTWHRSQTLVVGDGPRRERTRFMTQTHSC